MTLKSGTRRAKGRGSKGSRDGCVTWSFFFFQAEDGIRDGRVTGVQTCALPIWEGSSHEQPRNRREHFDDAERGAVVAQLLARSEERRVGKECRSRWST